MNNQDDVEAVSIGSLAITLSLVPIQRSLDESQSSDEEQCLASALHKEATVLKKNGDWAGAIAKLEEAKIDMLQSQGNYTYGMWCRLAKFYQYGGRYEDSMKEFDFIIADLDRHVRLSFHVDDPTVSYGRHSESKKMMAYKSIRNLRGIFKREREVVQAREARKLKREAAKKK